MIVLTTPRLLLRRLRPTDGPALHALLSDPRVMRFSASGAMDLQRTTEWMDWNIRLHQTRGLGIWAAVLPDSDQFVGQVGLIPQHIDGEVEIEITYRLLPQYWGQGLGSEAARAVRDYGFENLATPRLIGMIEPDNAASRRVAEKIGMRLMKQVVRGDKPACIYAVTRKEATQNSH